MTDVVGFVAGGAKECLKFIEDQISGTKTALYVCGSLALAFLFVAGAIGFNKYARWALDKQM
jgi:hypothetical protein